MKKYILLFSLFLVSFSQAHSQDILLLKTSGKVVVGDTTQISTPGPYNLYVQNGILTEKVKVALRNASEWSDDAFHITPTLAKVESTIINENHLVDMPSANSLVSNGYELQSMDAKLLAQIEWLWQHTIALDKENKKLRKEIDAIKAQIVE